MNFAHTQLIIYGAYIFGGTFVRNLGWPHWASWIATILCMGAIGIVIANLILIPLSKLSRLFSIMATMMLGMVLVEAANSLWGPMPFTLLGYLKGKIEIFGASTALANIYIMGAALIVIVLLLLFMRKTKQGKAMRCVAENRETAAYMGINVRKNMTLTVTISCVICGIIGMLIIPLYQISNTMGGNMGLKGFAAGIIGGFGSVPGAILGGIIIGLLENLAVLFVPAVYKDITAFVLVLVVLMIKPTGLFADLGNWSEHRRGLFLRKGGKFDG